MTTRRSFLGAACALLAGGVIPGVGEELAALSVGPVARTLTLVPPGTLGLVMSITLAPSPRAITVTGPGGELFSLPASSKNTIAEFSSTGKRWELIGWREGREGLAVGG